MRAFRLQKAGNAIDEYEDAFWPRAQTDAEVRSIRLAVADGATETSFSGLWAEILVEAFFQGHLRFDVVSDEMLPLQERWRQQLGSKPMPWYAEEKLRSGAYAAFVGVEIHEGNDASGGRCISYAVGDSCIMQIRGEELIQSFPIDRSEQFDSRPFLISSNPEGNGKLTSAVKRMEGTWKFGDTFLLMTDALACHFLKLWETSDDRRELLSIFNDLQDDEGFVARVNAEREHAIASAASPLRNDDVTLIRCRLIDS